TDTAEEKLRKEQNRYRWFVLLFAVTAGITLFAWPTVASSFNGWGWLVAIGAFTVVALILQFERVRMAMLATVAAFALAFAPTTLDSFQMTPEVVEADSTTIVATVTPPQTNDDETLPAPVAGSATVTEETPVTMECGIQEDGSFIPLITWMDLESCIEHATERERTDYIAAANDREDVDLTWNDIETYAERQRVSGLDARSILVM